MMNTRTITGIGAATGMLILILDGKTAFTGAEQGIDLCLQTVIPSLFPFFILSSMVTGAFTGSKFPISLQLFGIPRGGESLALTGFLGGYPVGAQSIAAAYRSGQLSRDQAERMLGFCNNAGPSFLFGLIAPMFPDIKFTWLLWGIHIISALLVGMILPKSRENVSLCPGPAPTLPDALNQSVRTMASVCGWIVLFRVFIAFLDRWFLWMLPTAWRVAVTGLLELSNGCSSLPMIDDVKLRFLICSGILGFGGLCVTMQTVSVTRGLSLLYYFPGKIMQTVISMLLAWLIQYTSPAVTFTAIGFGSIFAVFLRKIQNNSSIPRPIGV